MDHISELVFSILLRHIRGKDGVWLQLKKLTSASPVAAAFTGFVGDSNNRMERKDCVV